MNLLALMNEKDSAIRERDHALAEKKAAIAERDIAFSQRDAAMAERNAAIVERDNALAALELARTNGFNMNNGNGFHQGPLNGTKNINHHDQLSHVQSSPLQLADSPYDHVREMHISEAYPISTAGGGRGGAEARGGREEGGGSDEAGGRRAREEGRGEEDEEAAQKEAQICWATPPALLRGDPGVGRQVGVEPYAIAKYMGEKHRDVLPANYRKVLAVQLRNFAAKGRLFKVKASFKLAAAEEKKAAVAVAKKKKKAPAAAVTAANKRKRTVRSAAKKPVAAAAAPKETKKARAKRARKAAPAPAQPMQKQVNKSVRAAGTTRKANKASA